MHTSSPSPYSPSPTRRSLSPSPAMLAPSGSSGVGFTPPSPLRGRTQSFGSTPQGTAHGHHHGHAIHSSSTTSLPTWSGIHPSHTHTTTASLQQVRKLIINKIECFFMGRHAKWVKIRKSLVVDFFYLHCENYTLLKF